MLNDEGRFVAAGLDQASGPLLASQRLGGIDAKAASGWHNPVRNRSETANARYSTSTATVVSSHLSAEPGRKITLRYEPPDCVCPTRAEQPQ
jgi:hypothetical protein